VFAVNIDKKEADLPINEASFFPQL